MLELVSCFMMLAVNTLQKLKLLAFLQQKLFVLLE